MKTLPLILACLLSISAQAQLPFTSPKAAGFDPARLEVFHQSMRRFVDQGLHAGLITLVARGGRIVDFQTYGYRDIELWPSHWRNISLSTSTTSLPSFKRDITRL